MNDAFVNRLHRLEAEADRVRVRPVERRDAAATAFLMDERVAAELISWTAPMSEEDALERIACSRGALADGSAVDFAILGPSGGELMGWIGFWREDDGRVFVGYWLGRPFQRRGLLVEAARLAMPLAAGVLRVRDIWARVQLTNPPSITVLERLGFERVAGTDKGYLPYVLRNAA